MGNEQRPNYHVVYRLGDLKVVDSHFPVSSAFVTRQLICITRRSFFFCIFGKLEKRTLLKKLASSIKTESKFDGDVRSDGIAPFGRASTEELICIQTNWTNWRNRIKITQVASQQASQLVSPDEIDNLTV